MYNVWRMENLHHRREFLKLADTSRAVSAQVNLADPRRPSSDATPAAPASAPVRATVSTPVSTNALCFLCARDLAALLQARKVSARDVMAAHLERIRQINPKLNAIV